jgi:mannose-1-phosphate guanylyltransferase/mannose-6-phosphate isomerase
MLLNESPIGSTQLLKLHPVILCGGAGSRLWPLSRLAVPKQLLELMTSRSMLVETVLRLRGLKDVRKPLIVCNEDQRFLVAEQLREANIQPLALMLEPFRRDTAPAICCAAAYLAQQDPDAVMLVLPADHHIANVPAFHTAIQRGLGLAAQGHLVAFGIVPDAPETGYGYIESGDLIEAGARRVNRFVEKPCAADASEYLASGYLWNGGIFCFQVSTLLEELKRLAPEMLDACEATVNEGRTDLDFFRLGESAFERCPSGSIDRVVMEKTDRAVVLPVDLGWNDVGSWGALWACTPQDENGNACIGDVVALDTANCYLRSEKRLVATLGVEDLVVVETADAVLVVGRNRSQEVKELVEHLRELERPEHADHRKVYRPWGSYESTDLGERFRVKRLIVKPGAQLSLQRHVHRSEHWVVVSGTAEVTVGDRTSLIGENESIYVPLGANHRLRNPGRIELHLVEVQSGSYLEEDDIIRLDDVYGRERS